MITIKNLAKNYYLQDSSCLQILSHLNLTITSANLVVVLGPSGCGKTTLLNLISGIDANYEGNISFSDPQTKTGYMFQTPSLIPWRTVDHNIKIGAEIEGNLNYNLDKKTDELLTKYDLNGFEDSYPHTLSQGMQQRVSLIRVLLHGANLLLLDEPFSRVDYLFKRKLYSDINDLIINEDITIILVTHDIEEAVLLGDKVYVLSKRPATVIEEVDIEIDRKNRIPDYPGVTPEMEKFVKKIWNALEQANN